MMLQLTVIEKEKWTLIAYPHKFRSGKLNNLSSLHFSILSFVTRGTRYSSLVVIKTILSTVPLKCNVALARE